MRFELLGPLRVRLGQREIAVGAARERTLLAMLLLRANRPVSHDRLIDAIWPTRPPKHARNQLQVLVSRLRRQIAAAGATDQLIVTEPAGYRATIGLTDLDVDEFHQLVATARTDVGAGQHEQARSAYRTALDLWRGPALAGIEGELVRQAANSLDEERAQAYEECIDAELATGTAGELIAELIDLVHQHRHRERLHGCLMLALYRAGRQADALAAFRNARRLLRDELGVEPGVELRELHRAILDRDPALDVPQRPAPPAPSPPKPPQLPKPRELPGDVAGFTGREDALEALDRLLPDQQAATGPVVISAVAGTAGVGKTALAVHWAHRVAERFPDGQLFVNLRGYDPDQPLSPAEALARLLTALGVAGRDVPVELDDQAARYRSEVAGRRMMIVLDNVASVEQVRPLLPGTGSCMVVVTSRDKLAGLVARHGARRLDLDLLPPADATELLRGLIGPRVDADPEAAALLAERCARLPLALRVAAELAASRPAVPLADLADELSDQQRRLDLLAAGDDPYAAVKVVFSWSIRHLPPAAARTFRLLGLHPGTDFDAYATAALADCDLEPARRTLELLGRACLLHVTGPDRYGMHDLLRAYAAHLSRTGDTDQRRRAALTRLFDYYLGTASIAMDRWYPTEANRRPRIPAAASPTPSLDDPDTALRWLSTERPCLVATAAYTANHRWPAVAIQLSEILYRYLEGGHFVDAFAVHRHAHHASRQADDLTSQAHALRRLGVTHLRIGQHSAAADHLEQALTLFRRMGHQDGEARALSSLGSVEVKLGRYGRAETYVKRALTLFRRGGDQDGAATALGHLGNVLRRQGHYRQAAEHLQEALTLYRELDDPLGEAAARNNLSNVEKQLGNFERASEHLWSALELCRKLGNRQGEAVALDNLGFLQLHFGQPERATGYFEQGAALFREMGDQAGEAWALNGLGHAAHLAGRHIDAITHYTDALIRAADTGIRDQRAFAHAGLGDVHHARGDLAVAQAHYEQALALYTELGMPEAKEVRDRLTARGGPTQGQPSSP